MSSQEFSPKQLEQLGLVMDSKIEPIRSDIKEIKNHFRSFRRGCKNIKRWC